MEHNLVKRGLNRIILLPIVLSVLYAGVLLWQLNRMLDESRWIQHTTQVLSMASETQRHIQAQESALRGYILTRSPFFNSQFTRADFTIDSVLQRLHQQVLDNKVQVRRLDTLMQIYWDWQANAKHEFASIATTQNTTVQDSNIFVRARYVEVMRGVFQRINIEEHQLYEMRTSQFDGGTFWLTISIAALSIILGLIVGFYARQQATRFVDRFSEAVKEATQNRDLLQTTILSIGDAIIVTGPDHRITLMNIRAEELTGWTQDEARNRPVGEVFRIVDETSRAPIENPISAALREHRTIQLSRQTVLLSRTGVDYSIEDSAAPIHSSRHEVIGAVLVFRDATLRREAELQAQQREREFRALIENAPDIITRYDKDSRIIYVNPAIEYLLGIAPQALIGRRFKDVGIPEHVYAPWEQAVQDVFTTGRNISIEIQYQTMHGIRQYNMRLVPESDSHGIQSVISVAHDITDIKRTEEQLRESELRFRNVIENTPDAFYLLRAVRNNRNAIVDFVFEYINARGAELITVPVSECLGRKLTEVMPGERPKQFVEKYANIIEKGLPIDEEEYHVLSPYLRRAVWLRSQYIPIGDNLAITTVDVTERTQTEQALRRSEERYRHLVENASEAIFSTDKDGHFIYANPYIREISGYSAEDVHNIRFDEIAALDHRDRIRHHFYRQFLSKTPSSYIEAPFVTKFGEERWLAITSTLRMTTSIEGPTSEIEGFDCIATDITSRRHLESELREARNQAEASERAITGRAQHIVNEIRTPLTSILTMSRMLEQSHSSANLEEIANGIALNVQRALSATDSLKSP